MKRKLIHNGLSLLIATAAFLGGVGSVAAADKKPNILMLMTDDTGWGDFGCYGGGANLGHPTRTLIASPRKAPYSRAGMARRVARPAALRS